jgi:hypothetical protein
VSGDGGTPVNIIKAEDRQIAHGPQLLPGGRAVLFTMARTDNDWDSAQIVVQSLDTGTRRVVVNGASDARYVASGHLVYATGNELQAVPFDIATLSVTGKPVTIVDEVARADVTGAAHFGVSVKGLLVYVPACSTNYERGHLCGSIARARRSPSRRPRDRTTTRDCRRTGRALHSSSRTRNEISGSSNSPAERSHESGAQYQSRRRPG